MNLKPTCVALLSLSIALGLAACKPGADGQAPAPSGIRPDRRRTRRRRQSRCRDLRRRRLLHLPAGLEVVGRLQRGHRQQGQLPVDRLRRRHRPDQGRHGRFRFVRQAAAAARNSPQAGLGQFPSAIGGVVPVVNVDGLQPGQLRLTGPLLADIFLGKVTTWNDPAIAALNPGVGAARRQDQRRPPLRRFGHHLQLRPTTCPRSARSGRARSAKAPRCSGRPASAARATKAWPSYVKQIKGSIGYVELAYALQNKMPYTSLQNAAGNWVQPNAETLRSRRRQRRLGQRQGLQPGDHQCTGRRGVADHRDQLHPDAQAAQGRQAQQATRSRSSSGRSRTARRRPRRWTTCRCRRSWCSRSKRTGRASSSDVPARAHARGLLPAHARAARRSSDFAALMPRIESLGSRLRGNDEHQATSLMNATALAVPSADQPRPADARADRLFRWRRSPRAGRSCWSRWPAPRCRCCGAGAQVLRDAGPELLLFVANGIRSRTSTARSRRSTARGHRADRDDHRRAGELRHRLVPDRSRAALAARAGRHRDRTARRHPVDHLRHVGPVRAGAGDDRVRHAVDQRPPGHRCRSSASLFQGPPLGIGMLTAGFVLAIMVIPFISSVMREVFLTVPTRLKESAYALGSTRWEVSWDVVLPYTRSAVIGGIFLGLGPRARRNHGGGLRDRQQRTPVAVAAGAGHHDRRADRQRIRRSRPKPTARRCCCSASCCSS